MHQYKDGRFYTGCEPQKVSFELPGGFWIDNRTPLDCVTAIALTAPDKEASIDLCLMLDAVADIKEDLLRYANDAKIDWEGPESIKVGNVDGYCLFTGVDGVIDACEICADISSHNIKNGQGELYGRLNIMVVSAVNDIHEYMRSEEFLSFLAGVRVDS